MNANRLLDLYDRVADAPDAIARLRRFVLDVSISGSFIGDCDKWVSVPIEECLEPLEDGRFIHQGWSPRCETFPATAPEKWGVLKTTAIQDGFFLENENKELPDHLSPKEKLEVSAGDILITCAGPRARCGIATSVPSVRSRLMISGKMYRFRADQFQILTEFLTLFLRSSMSWAAIDAMKTGSSESGLNLTKDRFRNLEVRFGSLDQQRKILAKVEELVALLDGLVAARQQREATRDRLTAASLARLTVPETDAGAFPAHVRFALDVLPALTTCPDQIKQLCQTILNLAVRGKLVEQDPADEPLPRIDKGLPSDAEVPFELPIGWQWSRLRSLGTLKGGGTPSKARDDFWNGNIPWVSPKDMKVDYIDAAELSITDLAVAGSAVNLIEPESVLFVVRGMILAHSFPVAISRVPLTINQDMKAIILKKPEMAEYVLRALKGLTPEMLTRVRRSSHGTCRIEGSDYGDFLIPLPPLAEQRRIVAKVDELKALCDRLEAALATADTTRQRLLEALLHEALTPDEARGAAA